MSHVPDKTNVIDISSARAAPPPVGLAAALQALRHQTRERSHWAHARLVPQLALREVGLCDPGFTIPAWGGQYASGATLVVLCGPDVGDAILFAAFLPALLTHAQASGMRVMVTCRPTLQRLFKSSFPRAAVLTPSEAMQQIDAAKTFPAKFWQVPIAELKHWIPRPPLVAYLRPHPEDVALMCHVLASYPVRPDAVDGPRIGFALGPMEPIAGTPKKDAALNAFHKFLATKSTRLLGSYFYLGVAEEKPVSPPHPELRATEFGDLLNDFSRSAALMQEMDTVIVSCVSAANLAGALGLSAHVFLRHQSDGRWNPETGWYPKTRCYSEREADTWYIPLLRQFDELSQGAQAPNEKLRHSK